MQQAVTRRMMVKYLRQLVQCIYFSIYQVKLKVINVLNVTQLIIKRLHGPVCHTLFRFKF